MSKNVALDGIIPYAMLKKIKVQDTNGIITAVFEDDKLVITLADNSVLEVPFSNMLLHNNKEDVLDKLSINSENKLLFDNQIVCDLSETVKNIEIDNTTNELLITYHNMSVFRIPLEPMITDIVQKILEDSDLGGGGNGGVVQTDGLMFLHSEVKTKQDLINITNAKNGQTVIVQSDSSKDNQRSLYTYKKRQWLWVGSLSENRDFAKQPININTEVIGTITEKLIPNTIARVNQLHNHNNKAILDGISENVYNELSYKGKKISSIKITDKDNANFNDISSLKLYHFIGQKKGDLLELKLNAKSNDLKDMPKTHSQNKVLVSNAQEQKYELKGIDELTTSKENYTTVITSDNWGDNSALGYYRTVVTHNLNSKNLLVAFYDANDTVKKTYEYTILNELEIEVRSNDNNECRIVINCSQGTAKGLGGGSGGGSDHTHSNLSILNKFTEDKFGNLVFDGTRVFTNFNPLVYKVTWNQELFDELKLLVDYNTIFQEQDIRIITSSEFIIENKYGITNNSVTDKANEIHLQIKEDEFIVLDVFIKPAEMQKYITGINPNTKIYIKGYFSGTLVINYFDTSCIQTK